MNVQQAYAVTPTVGSLAATLTIASGQTDLGTPTISTGTCTTVTATATGAVASGAHPDVIAYNSSASWSAITGYSPSTSGGLTVNAYLTSNQANFDICNWTSGSVTAGDAKLNWRVLR